MTRIEVASTGRIRLPAESGKWLSLEVEQLRGSGASWIIVLEGSNSGSKYSTVLTHTDTDPGDAVSINNATPAIFSAGFAVNVLSLSLGTAQALAVRVHGVE